MKIKFQLILILFVIIFYSFHNNVFAVTVNINDTTTNTDIVTLPVLGEINDILSNKIEFIFEVNWVQFELLGIISNDNYALNNNNVSYNYDWETRLLTVSCGNLATNSSNRLFDIKLRLLPRMDFFRPNEIFQITPRKVVATNNSGTTDTFDLASTTANIQIDTIAANQTFYESISPNYPNPFSYETVVFFSINEATPIKFHLYKPNGSLVQTSPNDNYLDNCLNYKIYNSTGEEIVLMDKNWENYEFKQGLYKIIFTVNRQNISLGNYTLVLETNKSNYTVNMIYSN